MAAYQYAGISTTWSRVRLAAFALTISLTNGTVRTHGAEKSTGNRI